MDAERKARTVGLLAYFLGNPDEFAMLKGVLCMGHLPGGHSDPVIDACFDNIMIATRMDAINKAARTAA